MGSEFISFFSFPILLLDLYMKNVYGLLLVLLCASCVRQVGNNVTDVVCVENVLYRGWYDCIKLSNSKVSIIVNPTYGGQILYFGLNETNENVLWADSVVNGWTINEYAEKHRSPDSGRFDIGPERITEHIHDSIWAGFYQSFVEVDAVRLQSPDSQTMGIKVEKIYKLDRQNPTLHVIQKMTNISRHEVEYCFWTRTLLPSGGIYFCDAHTDTNHLTAYSEMSLLDDSLHPSLPSEDRVHCANNIFTAYPGGEKEYRYGINSTTGTFCYLRNHLLYVKQNVYVPNGTYDCNNGINFTNMIYFCNQFIEMEPLSPMVKLQPGESYQYEEVWGLYNW